MGSKRVVILVCSVSIFLTVVQGRPYESNEDYDSESNEVKQNYVTPNPGRPTEPVRHATQAEGAPVQQDPVETTTQYKYFDIIQPYTMEVPTLHSIRHSAGTLYYSVAPQENAYEKLMQVYKDNFEVPFNRNLPSHLPPPKD